jgi:hypothetical protein
MKFYISKITISEDLSVNEIVITKPDSKNVTLNTMRRLKSIGIPDLYVALYDPKHYKALLKNQRKQSKFKPLNKKELKKLEEEEFSS